MRSWKVPPAQSSAPGETRLNQTVCLTFTPRTGFASLTHCPQTPLLQAGCDGGSAWFLCLQKQRFWGSRPRIYFLKGVHEVFKMCLNCWDKYIPRSLIRALSASWVANNLKASKRKQHNQTLGRWLLHLIQILFCSLMVPLLSSGFVCLLLGSCQCEQDSRPQDSRCNV